MADFRDNDNSVIFKAGGGESLVKGCPWALATCRKHCSYWESHSKGLFPMRIPTLQGGAGTWRSQVKDPCHNVQGHLHGGQRIPMIRTRALRICHHKSDVQKCKFIYNWVQLRTSSSGWWREEVKRWETEYTNGSWLDQIRKELWPTTFSNLCRKPAPCLQYTSLEASVKQLDLQEASLVSLVTIQEA